MVLKNIYNLLVRVVRVVLNHMNCAQACDGPRVHVVSILATSFTASLIIRVCKWLI